MTEPALTLTAANDNPGGPTRIGIALSGLVTLLARAELRRSDGPDAADSPVRPGTHHQTKEAMR